MPTPSSCPSPEPAPVRRLLVLTPDVRHFVLAANRMRLTGCHVTRATSLATAIQLLRASPHEVLLLDLVPDGDQESWVPHLLAEDHSLRIVVLADLGELRRAVRCLRAGAVDCLAKPLDPGQLRRVMDAAATPASDPAGTMASTATCMHLAMDSIRRAARSDLPVMLSGEHGTGKTWFAEFLHRCSQRAHQPFVAINCPSLSEELAASELFGHRRGSFTGAVSDQIGRVETAAGGSLFLDELGDLPLGVQAKILRFLQERAYERLGETISRHADVRLITATNQDLLALIASGRFRADLFFRLSGLEITIPPLRQRRSDIAGLARHFLRLHAQRHGRAIGLGPGTLELLVAHDWPGNVRELSNEIERAVVMTGGPLIHPADLSLRLQAATRPTVYLGGDFTLRQIGDEHITEVLRRHLRVGEAAGVLDIERSTLLSRRRRLGLGLARASSMQTSG